MCVFIHEHVQYQLDVEVSRVVDVGHHSIELCVDLGIVRMIVQQGPPAHRHWRIKPFGFQILEKHSHS